MTEFKRPNCSVCGQTVERNEGHIGPPFVENVRHTVCSTKCKKCLNFVSNIVEHAQKCRENDQSIRI